MRKNNDLFGIKKLQFFLFALLCFDVLAQNASEYKKEWEGDTFIIDGFDVDGKTYDGFISAVGDPYYGLDKVECKVENHGFAEDNIELKVLQFRRGLELEKKGYVKDLAMYDDKYPTAKDKVTEEAKCYIDIIKRKKYPIKNGELVSFKVEIKIKDTFWKIGGAREFYFWKIKEDRYDFLYNIYSYYKH